MNKKRLLKLADFLEIVPTRAFDISLWQAHEADKPEGKVPGECGFAGCAVGWAAHAKLFSGFKFEDDIPYYRGEWGWGAVRKVFGLGRLPIETGDFTPATYLFTGRAYDKTPSAKDVALRIREFCATTS